MLDPGVSNLTEVMKRVNTSYRLKFCPGKKRELVFQGVAQFLGGTLIGAYPVSLCYGKRSAFTHSKKEDEPQLNDLNGLRLEQSLKETSFLQKRKRTIIIATSMH